MIRRSTFALGAAMIGLASPVEANGRFPAANQIVVDPDDPEHVVVRATYGTMTSHDGGRTRAIVCERAIGTTGEADPMLGVFAGGTMVAGVVSGLASTRDDGCSWSLVPGLPPRNFVVDVTVEARDPRHGVVVTSSEGQRGTFETVLFETTDGAVTFHRLGAPLGPDFLALTVEVAPSDPRRLYVSGTVTSDGGAQTQAIARSNDRGTSFTRTILTSYGAGFSAWLSAIDPNDPNTLYVRVRTTDKDRLVVSHDGAATFREVRAAAGSLTGFALSPDGAEVAVGGAGDGIWIASTRSFAWTRQSDVHAQCLTWTRRGLYACGVEWLDHFVVGLSTDRGSTFTPLGHMADPCPRRCPSGTTVANQCTGDAWGEIRSAIGQAPEVCGKSESVPVATSVERSPPFGTGSVRVGLGVLVVSAVSAGIVASRRRRRRRGQ